MALKSGKNIDLNLVGMYLDSIIYYFYCYLRIECLESNPEELAYLFWQERSSKMCSPEQVIRQLNCQFVFITLYALLTGLLVRRRAI